MARRKDIEYCHSRKSEQKFYVSAGWPARTWRCSDGELRFLSRFEGREAQSPVRDLGRCSQHKATFIHPLQPKLPNHLSVVWPTSLLRRFASTRRRSLGASLVHHIAPYRQIGPQILTRPVQHQDEFGESDPPDKLPSQPTSNRCIQTLGTSTKKISRLIQMRIPQSHRRPRLRIILRKSNRRNSIGARPTQRISRAFWTNAYSSWNVGNVY